MSENQTAFQVNQKIVYPSQGVGKITEIRPKKFKDTELLYYVIYLEVSDMTIMVPVDRGEELGLRAIVPAEEAQKALDMIGEEFEPITSDWKLRYQMNLDLLKKGSISDIATIVRCLYHRSKVKELPILERKLYDSAKKLLEDEIALSLNKSTKEIEAMIHAKLEPLGLLQAKHPAAANKALMDDSDDDEFLEPEDSTDKSLEDDDDILDDNDDLDEE